MARNEQSGSYPAPILDRGHRSSAVPRLMLLAVILVVSASLFVIFKERIDQDIVLGLLGVLAMVGVFFLVSTVIGLVVIMPRSSGDPLAAAFLDSESDGIVITDPKGRVVYANRAYGAMTGVREASQIQTLETILSAHREATEVVYRLSNALRAGRSAKEEFRLTHPLNPKRAKGDEVRWYRLSVRVVPAFREAGGKQLNAWQLADITQERSDQERIFKELQYAIDYLDHAPAGFFSAGRDGEIFYINATLAEWLGLDLTRFQPGSLKLQELIAGDGVALINSVEPAGDMDRTASFDLDLLKHNGQLLPATLIHRVSPARDGAPGDSRTLVLSRFGDGDGASIAATAEMRFARFFNNTPMAIASVDRQGRILRPNAPFVRLFSEIITRDQMDRGALFEQVLHPGDRQAFGDALAAAADRQAHIPPVDSRHPLNEERHFRFYVSGLIEETGDDAEEAAIIYAVETTEQKALEVQMAQTQKMNAVGTLAGGIAHDFNNVLTAILLSADHLLMSMRPSDSGFADLMEIKRNSNRAAALVRQLLAFSRKQTMRPTVLSMVDVVGDLRMLLDRLTGTKVKLEIDYGRDLWPVRTDLGQFEQVIINLAVNARDAMPEGGTLTITLRNVSVEESMAYGYRGLVPAEYVMIEVADEGIGIAPEMLDKIFEPFFTTKDVGKGTGLGLSMVYGIVKQSGGYIYADSQVGSGTKFRLMLPRYVAQEQEDIYEMPADRSVVLPNGKSHGVEQAAIGKKAEPADLTGGSAVVLLVEDEEAVRRGGKRMLETRGYEVHEAESGAEALEIMQELGGAVDIVVSDVVMPEMDGPTLLRELRKDYPDLKFIFVSGYAEDAFARNLPAEAQFGFLAKPFSLKQLAVAVREMLDG